MTMALSKRAAVPTVQVTDIFSTPELFEHAQRVAKMFAQSSLVPDHLKQNNGADALIAYGIARAMGEQPLTVMQNIYFVQGKPGWSTKYKIARANSAGVFRKPIRWKSTGEGDELSVTAFATLADGEDVSVKADMALAKAEGWTKNAKYKTMPEHMLRWRSASMLIDLYAPDVMTALPAIDEVDIDERPMGRVSVASEETKPKTARELLSVVEPDPQPKSEPRDVIDVSSDDEELPPHDADTGEVIEPEDSEDV